eukprot:m.11355 g.11355  ORF g.11355 m.11355 type:complete len:320 (-) comp3823_c0_seq1:458-1417(-)
MELMHLLRILFLSFGLLLVFIGASVLWDYIDTHRALEDDAAGAANYYVFTLWIFIGFSVGAAILRKKLEQLHNLLVMVVFAIFTVHFSGLINTQRDFATSFAQLTKLRGELQGFTNETSSDVMTSVREEFSGGLLAVIGMVIAIFTLTSRVPPMLRRKSAKITPNDPNESVSSTTQLHQKPRPTNVIRITNLLSLVFSVVFAIVSWFILWIHTSLASPTNTPVYTFTASVLISLMTLLITVLFKHAGAAVFCIIYVGLFGTFALGIGLTVNSLSSDMNINSVRAATFFGAMSSLISAIPACVFMVHESHTLHLPSLDVN